MHFDENRQEKLEREVEGLKTVVHSLFSFLKEWKEATVQNEILKTELLECRNERDALLLKVEELEKNKTVGNHVISKFSEENSFLSDKNNESDTSFLDLLEGRVKPTFTEAQLLENELSKQLLSIKENEEEKIVVEDMKKKFLSQAFSLFAKNK